MLRGGIVEYIGRRDEQVKYHGYRVELGEITGVLSRHPQVRDSVVRVVKDRRGTDVMVAYYVSRQPIEAAELRKWLLQSLIAETIPNLFVHLRKLPLTLNGKVNHSALPTVEEARESIGHSYVAARTPVEQGLQAIWCEVLGMERVGIEDNFFELGGHSLLATQMLTRVREVFEVELALRTLFEQPTVAGLAENIETLLQAGARLSPAPILRAPREGELPLSLTQQRLWFIDQLEPGSPFYNIFTAVRLAGPLDTAALERVLAEIGRRHEALRTTFASSQGRPIQVISPSLELKLRLFDLRDLPAEQREEEARRLAQGEARKPFDLARGPLVRAALLRLDELEHLALFTMHHIISDGWSLNVLLREVVALYEAYSKGEGSPLPELPIQYADFAVWQREYLQAEVLHSQLSYWKRQLGPDAPKLELPTDRPRPNVQTYRGATCNFVLPADLLKSLNRVSREEGVTLFMLFLAAFQTLLHRYTGQDEVRVGSPVANRTRAETQELIGCFINTLVLRAELAGNPRFNQFLRRVKETVLAAYAHKDLPFEALVEHLQPERKLGHTPLFQVWFVFNPAMMKPFKLPGLTITPLSVESDTSQFDLTLTLSESGDEIRAGLTYSTDLFDRDTIEEMAARFRALLEGVAADPERRLLDIPLERDASRNIATETKAPEQTEDQFML